MGTFRQLVILSLLLTCVACGTSTTSSRDVDATVAVRVGGTVQAAAAQTPNAQPAAASSKALPIVLDDTFVGVLPGWPNASTGVAWFDETNYRIAPREPGKFVALAAPLVGALADGSITARFHKLSGPSGGGYGIVVRDQNSESRDGVRQDGRFVVAELGDEGTYGLWRRENMDWVDLIPWTASKAVNPGADANELTVSLEGDRLTLSANAVQLAATNIGLSSPGGVGVFVGGDGNEVVLERLTVQTSSRVERKRQPILTSVPVAIPTATARPTPRPSPTSTATAVKQPSPLIETGKQGKIWTNGAPQWHLVTTRQAFDDWQKAQLANDIVGLNQMISRGLAFPTTDGTKVLVLEHDGLFGPTRVRVLDGPQKDKAGWLNFEHVVE